MAHNLSGAEFEEIKKAFFEVDQDGDGVISENELVDAAFGKVDNCTEEDCAAIRAMCDLDDDGKISFCEFLEMMAEFQYDKGQSELGLKALFRAFDRNNDGVLSKDEIKRAWQMFINPDEEASEVEVTDWLHR